MEITQSIRFRIEYLSDTGWAAEGQTAPIDFVEMEEKWPDLGADLTNTQLYTLCYYALRRRSSPERRIPSTFKEWMAQVADVPTMLDGHGEPVEPGGSGPLDSGSEPSPEEVA